MYTSTAGAARRTSSRISTADADAIRVPHGTDASPRMLSSCPLTTASPWPVDDAPSSGLSSLLSPPPPALPIVRVYILRVYQDGSGRRRVYIYVPRRCGVL
uniref:Uncharacterized protein n=1 Tax=Zea mays TaxID=4577 RepID=A0A804PA54_MAIZE